MGWLRRRADATVAVVLGAATAVVLAGALDRSFDFDESVTVASTIRRGSALVPLTETTTFNNHPLFAVGQSLWWAIGGEGEARQRMLPVLYGAAAVAVLAGWVTRRFGALAGVTAGAVLALNPMFVTQARLVRGYSLATLGVVVATVTLIEHVRREQDRPGSGRVWVLAVHAVAVVVALGTHLYAALPLGAVGIGALLVLRRIDWRLWSAWVVAGVGVAAVYLPTFAELRDTAEARGTGFKPWFARLTTWEVLGSDRVTAVLVGAVAVVGVVALVTGRVSARPGLRVAAIVVPALVLAQGWILWQVVQPVDLYPRFFLVVVPLVALAAAVGVHRVPWLVAVVAVGLVFTLDHVSGIRDDEVPIRDASAAVLAADGLGLRACVVGGESLAVYGATAQEVNPRAVDPERELAGCDVFVRIGGWGAPLVAPARELLPHEGRIGDFEVFSSVPVPELGPCCSVVAAG